MSTCTPDAAASSAVEFADGPPVEMRELDENIYHAQTDLSLAPLTA